MDFLRLPSVATFFIGAEWFEPFVVVLMTPSLNMSRARTCARWTTTCALERKLSNELISTYWEERKQAVVKPTHAALEVAVLTGFWLRGWVRFKRRVIRRLVKGVGEMTTVFAFSRCWRSLCYFSRYINVQHFKKGSPYSLFFRLIQESLSKVMLSISNILSAVKQ